MVYPRCVMLAGLLLAAPAPAQLVCLGWSHPSAETFRVFAGAGPEPGAWSTNFLCVGKSAEFLPPAFGRWWFAVRAETTNGAASALSAPAVVDYLPAPALAGRPSVAVSVAVDRSENLATWTRETNAAGIWPATNAAAFFKCSEILLRPVLGL